MKRIDHFLKFYKRKLKEKGLLSSPENRKGFLEIKSLLYKNNIEILLSLEVLIRSITRNYDMGDEKVEDIVEKYVSQHRIRAWAYLTMINFLKENNIYNIFCNNLKESKGVTIRDYVMKNQATANPRNMFVSAFLWGPDANWPDIHREWLRLMHEEYNKEM